MTRFLLDDMFPPTAALLLREKYGHDAWHVRDLGLQGAPDDLVAREARESDQVLVTENVADFARETDVVLVFVLKSRLPAGRALASALARILEHWSKANPEPYVGAHWPGDER